MDKWYQDFCDSYRKEMKNIGTVMENKMKKLHINCLQCDNQLYKDWDKILDYRGIRPAQKFGINTVRFYGLPIIFCNKCHSICEVRLIEVSTSLETQTEELAVLQRYKGEPWVVFNKDNNAIYSLMYETKRLQKIEIEAQKLMESFVEIAKYQNDLLGHGLKEACENWDEATSVSFDITGLKKALEGEG